MGAPWEKYSATVAADRTLGQEALRQLGLTARHTLSGLAMVPIAVGNAANAAIDMGTGAINSVAGTHIPKIGPIDQSGLDLLGKPETPTERVVGQASEMLAGAPVMGAAALNSGVRALAPLADNMAAQAGGAIGSGVVGGTTGEVAPNSPWLKFAGNIVGALAGSGGVNAAQNIMARRAAQAAIPTTEELRAAGGAAYNEADNAGLVIRPEAMQRLNQQVRDDLAEFGFDRNLHPRAMAAINRLQEAEGQNISLKGVDLLRRVAAAAAKSQDSSEQTIAGRIIDHIDDMVNNLGADDVLQGNMDEGVAALNRARGLWSTMRKSEMIDEAILKATDRAASTNSGGNLQNTIRQNIRAILDSPAKRRGFNAEEIDAMRQLVRGTVTQNALRTLGRLAPSSNGWIGILTTMGGAGLGGGIGAGIGATVPLVASGAKAGANALTNRSIEELSALIRSGGMSPQEAMAQRLGGNGGQQISPYLQQLIQQLIAQSANQPASAPRALPPLHGVPSAASGSQGTGFQGQP